MNKKWTDVLNRARLGRPKSTLLHDLAKPMVIRIATIALAVAFSPSIACAQSWTALAHQPTFLAGTPVLLTDGTVMVSANTSAGYGSGQWWRLTPDSNGSYVNGTWSQMPSLPSGYAPLYFASAVLADGRVLIEGGEYNGASQAETTLGAIYSSTADSWTSVSPPSGWSRIGDAQSAVLANGALLLGNCCTTQQALFNAATLTWTVTGTGKADSNSEEGWTLLPSGSVLTVDAENGTHSELYSATANSWSSAGSTIVQLVDTTCVGGFEVGPAVLRPDGTVFATGGLSGTAIYNSGTGSWVAGPSFPSGLGIDDGPAALLPNGNILVVASPISPCYSKGSQYFEFNGTSLVSVAAPPNAANDASYVQRMLVLPTGQVLLTDGTSNVEIYAPAGTYNSSWRPVITSVASSLTAGTTYTITGLQFNGLSQGAMYGDDAQMATNYPLVRITNNSTGHVFYARTHDHSTMGVATGTTPVSTQFDLSMSIESGASSLVVTANGIPSQATPVTIVGAITDTSTMTEGVGPPASKGFENDTQVFGSMSPAATSNGHTYTRFLTLALPHGGGYSTHFAVSGFSTDPGQGWLYSATGQGVGFLGSNAFSYAYSAGTATWKWSSDPVFTGSGTTTCTIVHY